jgi:hypothetical protein
MTYYATLYCIGDARQQGPVQQARREVGESQISLPKAKTSKPAGRRSGQDARLFLRIVGASIEPFFPKAKLQPSPSPPADCIDRSQICGENWHALKAQSS